MAAREGNTLPDAARRNVHFVPCAVSEMGRCVAGSRLSDLWFLMMTCRSRMSWAPGIMDGRTEGLVTTGADAREAGKEI